MRAWLEMYPRESILVTRFEDLMHSDSMPEVERILRFIGVDTGALSRAQQRSPEAPKSTARVQMDAQDGQAIACISCCHHPQKCNRTQSDKDSTTR